MRKVRNPNYQNPDSPTYSGLVELEATENGLVRYSRSIVKKLHKHLDLDASSIVCDFGAGSGSLAKIFKDLFLLSPVCVELDPELCKRLQKDGFQSVEKLDDLQTNFDFIYTSNVLEHIEKDDETLIALRNKLNLGGRLGIYVPAHQFLYSSMDRQVGHFRRYSKSELISKVEQAGLRITYVSYDDFLGFFASLFLKFAGYNRGGLGSRLSLQIYDTLIFPVSAILDRIGFNKLLGKNIIMICSLSSSGLQNQSK